MGSTADWLPRLLEEESFRQSHAFWDGFKHNHKAHSMVALARLGASEERVKQHSRWQNEKSGIIPFTKEPELKQDIEVDSIKSDKIADYLGKNVGFYKVLDHFTDLYTTKYGKDVKKFICGELPPLIDGQLGSVFHGLIQLAYGYAGGSDQVVIEGVTNSYTQYVPITGTSDPKRSKDTSSFGTGTTDILDILKEIRENNNDDWKKQGSMTKVGDEGDKYLDYTDRIKIPEWFVPGKKDMDQVVKLLYWVLDMATVVYVQAEQVNDFFILHGVTSSWSLLQVVELMDYDTALGAIRALVAGILVVYGRMGAPNLSKKPEDFWTGETIDQAVWDKIIKETIKEEFENHIYKVVQCVYEAWKNNPGSPYARHYVAGARAALDNDLRLSPTEILSRFTK